MSRVSAEERLARKVYDEIGHLGFEEKKFAEFLSRCGYLIQFKLWKVVKHLMEFWVRELEGNSQKVKDSDEFLRQTIWAAQVLELMQEQEDKIKKD